MNKFKVITYLFKEFALFTFGGLLYLVIELAWRGRTHWSMAVVGGLCFIIVGLLNEFLTYTEPMELQAVKASILVTVIEFISGCIINLKLGWNVWDYSDVPFNLMGQVCLLYMIFWCFLAIPGIWLDDVMRYIWWGEPKPKYEWAIINLIKKLKKKGD